MFPRLRPTLAEVGTTLPPAFTNAGTISETLTAALPMLAELVGEDPASVTVELLTFWMVHGSSYTFSTQYAARRR